VLNYASAATRGPFRNINAHNAASAASAAENKKRRERERERERERYGEKGWETARKSEKSEWQLIPCID